MCADGEVTGSDWGRLVYLNCGQHHLHRKKGRERDRGIAILFSCCCQQRHVAFTDRLDQQPGTVGAELEGDLRHKSQVGLKTRETAQIFPVAFAGFGLSLIHI